MKVKISKMLVLNGLGALFGIGQFVVGILKNDAEISEAAYRAVDIIKKSSKH